MDQKKKARVVDKTVLVYAGKAFHHLYYNNPKVQKVTGIGEILVQGHRKCRISITLLI